MFKSSVIVASLAAALACVAFPSVATVIDFEDLAGKPFYDSLPANYAGIDWAGNFSAFDQQQYPYTPHSGIVSVASNGETGGDSSFSFGKAVSFGGAWFAGTDGTTVAFELYANNLLVSTTAALAISSTPGFLSSGYTGAVDRVKILESNGYYVFDDMAYTAAAVPEAETYALMLAGLGVLGVVARRRKRL